MDEEEDSTEETCPVCGGPAYLLGELGRTLHLRCRDCGMDFIQPQSVRGSLRKQGEEGPDGLQP